MGPPASLFLTWLLCCCVRAAWGQPPRPPLDLDVVPRITVPYGGLLGCRRFAGSVLNCSSLLLDEEKGLLYVGARGAVFALDAGDIATGASLSIEWEAGADLKQQCLNKGKDNQTECFNHVRFLQRFNQTHLYVCGTHAFSPLCTYIEEESFKMSSVFEDGKERCPYDPAKGYTGLLVDGELYTATQYEFRSSPDIRRNAPNPTLRTEDAPTRWLLEADFVGSALVRESSVGDDDEIYFFFTENSPEQTPYSSQTRVARVARVCKGDGGGQRTLQKKWTSFLKAQLECSIPDYQFHFNILRSVFVLKDHTLQTTTAFYGVFGLEWKNVKASAICRYSVADVQKAFEGPYMESQDSVLKWTEYTGKVPEPRPGSCITDLQRTKGINSSRDLPDDVLEFVRRHPLMSRPVLPGEQRPLLVTRSVDYTEMAVHRVVALNGWPFDVLFIGTDDGWLHRAVEVRGHMHIIEELQLFEEPQPIKSMVISRSKGSIYVGSHTAVLQLPLSTCHRYTSCLDCVFARDPFCAWDGLACVDTGSRSDRSGLIQDILTGNQGCENRSENVEYRMRSVMTGGDVLLTCELGSSLAVPRWTLNGGELQGYGLDSGSRIGTDGLLVIGARPGQSGDYSCFAVENGRLVPVVTYKLTVRQDGPPAPAVVLTTPSNSPSPLPLPSGDLSRGAPAPPRPEFQTYKNMETMYIALITVLGGLCLVLTVVLMYVTLCMPGRGGRYALREHRPDRRKGSRLELGTVSSHCNGRLEGDGADGSLQVVPGEGQGSPSKENPPPPPPPLPPPPPSTEHANGLSATLPSVLRKMNGNSYVLLRQSDPDTTSPLYHSFTEELNRILEKRKHTQLVTAPDESSV